MDKVNEMKCPNCNFENPDGSVFCQHCGVRMTSEAGNPKPEEKQVEEPAANTAKNVQNKLGGLASKLDRKVLLGGVAAICVLVLLIVIIASISGGGSGYVSCEAYISRVYLPADDETVVTYNGKPLGTKIDGKVSSYTVAQNGTAALMTVAESKTDEDGGSYTVYSVTKSGVKTLAEDVAMCGISADGSRAYCVSTDGELSLYTVKNGKKTKIDDEVNTRYGSVTISPKGSVVLYCTVDEDDGDTMLKAWRDGKTADVAKNYLAVAATDDGKYIYIMNDESSLYVTKFGGDDKEKLCSNVTSAQLNSTATEILMISDQKAYLSVKGGEKVKICNAAFMSAVDPIDSAGYVSIYRGVKTFVGTPIAYTRGSDDDISLGFIKKNGGEYELVKVAGNVASFSTANGKTLYFMRNGDLCSVELKEDAEVEKISEDIRAFSLTASGKSVYAIDSDMTLVKFTGKDKAKVADDVETSSHFSVIGEGVLYLIDVSSNSGEGTLVYSSNGKSKQTITDEATAVSSIAAFKLGWYTNSDEETFYTTNGSKFTQYK